MGLAWDVQALRELYLPFCGIKAVSMVGQLIEEIDLYTEVTSVNQADRKRILNTQI
jgi:hypothetical protein